MSLAKSLCSRKGKSDESCERISGDQPGVPESAMGKSQGFSFPIGVTHLWILVGVQKLRNLILGLQAPKIVGIIFVI